MKRRFPLLHKLSPSLYYKLSQLYQKLHFRHFPLWNSLTLYRTRIYWLKRFPDSKVYFDSIYKIPISVGRHSCSSNGIHINGFDMSLSIGSFTHIGRDLTLLSNTRHTPEFVSNQLHCLFMGDVSGSVSREKYADIYLKHHSARYGDIIIGNDVWIGDHVIIKGPVKIGDGAVIGAGCIVTKDVKSFEIVAGVPARHIRFRFSEDKIHALEAIAWWSWSNEKIKDSMELFYNVDEFIKKFSTE